MSNEAVPKIKEVDVELSEETEKDVEAVRKAVTDNDKSKFKKIDPDTL